jgi:cation diffusion facilitator family transporter
MDMKRLQTPRRMALLSIATSLLTLGLKFGAYFVTGSVGLLSDALEAFVNLAAGMIAFGAVTIAARPADATHTYGHDKAEYFASGVEGVLILVAAGSIVYAAIGRFLAPQPIEDLHIGIPIALVAAAANYTTARLMLGVSERHESIAIEADARHLLTDVWTSAGIVAGLAVIWFLPGWSILDPIMAVAVALHIVFTGVDLLRRSTAGLMDASLPDDEVRRIYRVIEAHLPKQAEYQALRTRTAGSRRFLEFNLLVPGATAVRDAHRLCDRLEAALEEALPNAQVLIHVEPREAGDETLRPHAPEAALRAHE